MIASVAAIVFAVVTSAVVGFQLALALGAPWGAYAMGGRFPGELPPLMRVAAVVQAVLLVLIVLIVLSRAGFLFPSMGGRVNMGGVGRCRRQRRRACTQHDDSEQG